MLSGLSRSVSLVPGAPPRCETPPGTPSPSTRMTVQPVVPPGSVKLPTLIPSTAVSVVFAIAGLKPCATPGIDAGLRPGATPGIDAGLRPGATPGIDAGLKPCTT